jgi:hypothetical protein
MIDYTIFYKTSYRSIADWAKENQWDFFISGYSLSDRVQSIFNNAPSSEKNWLVFPDSVPVMNNPAGSGAVFRMNARDEGQYIRSYVEQLTFDLTSKRFAVDITGFTRPHLLFLLKYLTVKRVPAFDAVYSIPIQYNEKEETRFSDEHVTEVRQVIGYEGAHTSNTSNDVLILAVGYDNQLISQVAQSKDKTRKIQIFGLPSLQPDMYQESVLRANIAAEDVGLGAGSDPNNYFAPADDPFVTASLLQEIVTKLSQRRPVSNLYLAPLSTKAQTLGFGLYYLSEWQDKAASVIFPICKQHLHDPSIGISKIWKYVVELPLAP